MTTKRKPILKIRYDCGCSYFFKMFQHNGTISSLDERGSHFGICQKHHDKLWDDMVKYGYAFGERQQTVDDLMEIRWEGEKRASEINADFTNIDAVEKGGE